MQTVWLDCDSETGRTYIEQGEDPAFGYLPVQATAEELAEWERAISEFDRVQAIMRKRWREALHEEIAKARVVNDGPFQSPGFPATTFTLKDICDDGVEPLLRVTERIARAAFKKLLGDQTDNSEVK